MIKKIQSLFIDLNAKNYGLEEISIGMSGDYIEALKYFGRNLTKFWYHLQEPDDFEPVDNCITSVLGQEVELTDEFKANYEKWLEREVFGTNIQWEQLLGNKYLYCKLNLDVVYIGGLVTRQEDN